MWSVTEDQPGAVKLPEPFQDRHKTRVAVKVSKVRAKQDRNDTRVNSRVSVKQHIRRFFVAVIFFAVLIGTVLGSAAGFIGGWVDSVIMRLVDLTLAFPAIFLAMAIAAALGPGLRNAFLAMVIVWWPIYARLMRAQVLSIKGREHIEAAVSIGATRGRILRRHILPLSFTPALVNATMDLGQVVILTATLSFLGLGAKPPSPEWGAMITEGARFFYQWWVAVAPGLAILTVGLAFNFLGDGLRDALDVKAA